MLKKNYGVQGVLLLEDSPIFGKAIPTQWDKAVEENPDIKTVIMTGGGNDVIQETGMAQACREMTDHSRQSEGTWRSSGKKWPIMEYRTLFTSATPSMPVPPAP